MAVRAARPGSAATSSRVPTAAMRRTCSASGCRRCSRTRSRRPARPARRRDRRRRSSTERSRSRARCSSKGVSTASIRAIAEWHASIPSGVRRRERGSARAAVLRARRHDFDTRVRRRRVQRRDGAAGGRSADYAGRGGRARGDADRHGARRLARPRQAPAGRRTRPTIRTATASPNEIPTALVDYMEFYLFNYFKPGHVSQTSATAQIGPATC